MTIDELNSLDFTMAFLKQTFKFFTPAFTFLLVKIVKDYFPDSSTFGFNRWLVKNEVLNPSAFALFG